MFSKLQSMLWRKFVVGGPEMKTGEKLFFRKPFLQKLIHRRKVVQMVSCLAGRME